MDCSQQPEHSDETLSPFIIEDEWIEREFRIYNRALRNLEAQFEAQRNDQSRRTDALENQLREISHLLPPVVEPPRFAPAVSGAAEDDHGIETDAVTALYQPQDPGTPVPTGETPSGTVGIRQHCSEILEAARLNISNEPEKQKPNNGRVVSVLSALSIVLSVGVAGAYTSFTGIKPETKTLQAPVQKPSSRPNRVTVIDASGARQAGSPGIHNMMARAEMGDVKAEVAMASAFLRGDGVEADPASAIRWSQAAAMQDDPSAEFMLATLYESGMKPNPALALQWYKAAASHGNAKAMHNLGVAFATGQGTARNPAAAVDWFKRAAQLGYRDSVFDLAVMYERGEGVAQNKQEALRWYDQAASQGDTEAQKRAAWLRTNP